MSCHSHVLCQDGSMRTPLYLSNRAEILPESTDCDFAAPPPMKNASAAASSCHSHAFRSWIASGSLQAAHSRVSVHDT